MCEEESGRVRFSKVKVFFFFRVVGFFIFFVSFHAFSRSSPSPFSLGDFNSPMTGLEGSFFGKWIALAAPKRETQKAR